MKPEPTGVTGATAGSRPEDAAPPQVPSPAFDRWLDGFFTWFAQHRPVDATCIGSHDFDDRLPDLSPDGLAARSGEAASLLGELSALPLEALDGARAADLTLARGVLEIDAWELASGHGVRHDPTAAMGAAVFGVLSLLRYPVHPIDERMSLVAARVAAMPHLFQDAQTSLAAAPPAWIERALEDGRGLRVLLTDGLPRYCAQEGVDDGPLRAPASAAAAALERFVAFLEDVPRDPGAYAAGSDALTMLFRTAHALDTTPDEAEAFAWDRLAERRAELVADAPTFGATEPREVLAQLARHHPTAAGYLDRHHEVFASHRDLAITRRLLTWPDFPVRYVPTPAWLQGTNRHVVVYPYHAPPALDPVDAVDFLAGAVPAEGAPDAAAFLARHNDSVIKLNHVVHHAGIGHHVQNWFAYHRARSRVGRVAAVDSAGRTVMLCGVTMAEGWASYVGRLMDEGGFLTPLERYATTYQELRAALRVIVDVRLHTGRWTFQQAEDFLVAEAGVDAAAARGEMTRLSLQPSVGSAYLLGMEQIVRLRADWQLAVGPGFDPGTFHDRLLSHGSIPVALIARSMTPSGVGA